MGFRTSNLQKLNPFFQGYYPPFSPVSASPLLASPLPAPAVSLPLGLRLPRCPPRCGSAPVRRRRCAGRPWISVSSSRGRPDSSRGASRRLSTVPRCSAVRGVRTRRSAPLHQVSGRCPDDCFRGAGGRPGSERRVDPFSGVLLEHLGERLLLRYACSQAQDRRTRKE